VLGKCRGAGSGWWQADAVALPATGWRVRLTLTASNAEMQLNTNRPCVAG
jgi:hypothetical protein